MFKKTISLILSLSLVITQPIFAQGLAQLNLAQYLGQARPAVTDSFRPTQLRYFSYDNINNSFRILLDKGDAKDIKDNQLKEQAKELMDYFLIGVTLPNDAFWVNLRPDSPENIIDPELEKTGLGKILLEADLQLKKDTASFTSPQTPEGKAYWDKLYKKAGELFGTENITIPTLTRPWIVPGEIIVRESQDSAYIYKATLKIMLEEDYLTSRGGSRTAPTPDQYNFSDPRLKELNEYSTQIIRETIIPKLTQKVNSGKTYAKLRQAYYSLVLSRWFKMRFAGKSGQYADLIDKHDLTNLTAQEPYDKRTYFKEYQESFAQGEYNLKEQVYTPYGQSVRSYMSGGFTAIDMNISGPGIKTETASNPAEQQLLAQPGKNTVILDKNFEIVDPKQPLALAASPMSEEGEFGKRGGFLSPERWDYQQDLRKILLENGFLNEEADTIANVLVRLYPGSLDNLVEDGFLTLDQKKLLLGLKQVDLKQFIVKFNEDKEKYKNYKDENGKFSERQILNILFNKLFSFVRMQELLADGLSKSDAIQIVIRHGNPKAWWEKAKGIRDELVGDGLSRSDATRLVIKHANPKNWWEGTKIIRDQLVSDGLSKADVSRTITRYANPKNWWEEAKDIRNELMADGLSRTYATRIVLGWANPKKWWQGIKFIRDELVGGILSKSFATTIVLEHSNPKAWWNMVKEIIGKIVLLNPALTQKELVREFIRTSPDNLAGKLFGIDDAQFKELLRPLKELKNAATSPLTLEYEIGAIGDAREALAGLPSEIINNKHWWEMFLTSLTPLSELLEIVNKIAKGYSEFLTGDLYVPKLHKALGDNSLASEIVREELRALGVSAINTASEKELLIAFNNILRDRYFPKKIDGKKYESLIHIEIEPLLKRALWPNSELAGLDDLDYCRINRELLGIIYPREIRQTYAMLGHEKTKILLNNILPKLLRIEREVKENMDRYKKELTDFFGGLSNDRSINISADEKERLTVKYSKINESDDIDYILDAAEEANRLRIYRSTEILKTDKGKDATASPLTVTEMKRQIGDILVGWVDVRMARGYEKSIDSLEEMEKLVESVKKIISEMGDYAEKKLKESMEYVRQGPSSHYAHSSQDMENTLLIIGKLKSLIIPKEKNEADDEGSAASPLTNGGYVVNDADREQISNMKKILNMFPDNGKRLIGSNSHFEGLYNETKQKLQIYWKTEETYDIQKAFEAAVFFYRALTGFHPWGKSPVPEIEDKVGTLWGGTDFLIKKIVEKLKSLIGRDIAEFRKIVNTEVDPNELDELKRELSLKNSKATVAYILFLLSDKFKPYHNIPGFFIEEAKERYNHIKTELEIFDFPVAASPLGEKLIDNNDRYGNLRYVEYETLSDLTRANLWNSFQSVASYVKYDPEYNWGFAVELNERGGIGRVMGAVKYKKDTATVPLTYVLGDSSEYIKNDITSALKAKTKQKNADAVASPLTVEGYIIDDKAKEKIENIKHTIKMFPSEAREFIAQPRNQKSKEELEVLYQETNKKITESREANDIIEASEVVRKFYATVAGIQFQESSIAPEVSKKLVELEEMGLIVNAVVKKMKYLIEVDMTELEEVILNKQDIDFTELESIINKLSLNNLKSAALEMKELFKKYQPQEHKEYSKKWLSIRSELEIFDIPVAASPLFLSDEEKRTITDIKNKIDSFPRAYVEWRLRSKHQDQLFGEMIKYRSADINQAGNDIELVISKIKSFLKDSKLKDEQFEDERFAILELERLEALIKGINRSITNNMREEFEKLSIKDELKVKEFNTFLEKNWLAAAADYVGNVILRDSNDVSAKEWRQLVKDIVFYRLGSSQARSSSSIASELEVNAFPRNPLGGIDFTDKAMRIGLEPMGSFAGLKLVLPEVANVAAIDLDAEFKQIQAMVSSGIRPADTRILEFAAACYYRGEFSPRIGEITSCLQQAHFLDELLGRESSQALRLATMLPEVLYSSGLN